MAEHTRAHPLIGLLVIAGALTPYLAASNVLPSDDSDFGAPRWVVAWLVVVCFIYPGLMVLGGVAEQDGGRTQRRAGFFGPTMAALIPVLLALHAGRHALTRAGLVQTAWFALAALTAFVALLYLRRLVRLIAGMRANTVVLALLVAAPASASERTVAVTFDDLPGASLTGADVATLRENTQKLLAGFKEDGVPVAAFVNEGKLAVEGETAADAEARRAVLKMWTDAGHELGNHTYSHRSLNRIPLEEFQADVVRGEPMTRALMEAKGGRLRYFRHPFLQVGLELEKRRAFEGFLKERGYTIAPVTIDNDEWVFAAIYADAVKKGDRAQADRIADAYVAYMDGVFAFVEDLSRRVVGREIPQVLLVHANALNADHFPRIARVLKARGYRFATLEEALKDEAYGRPDTYVGAWGISWLHHWEITEGRKRTPSPDPPAWVTQAYETRGR